MGKKQGDSDRGLSTESKVHLALLGIWVLLGIPTVLYWRNSILWVAFMSLYAIVITHWTLYEAARAKREAQKSVGGPSS